MNTMFPHLTHTQLLEQIAAFDVVKYCTSRNFVTGGVSRLSPYITHGVITIDEIVRLSLQKYPIDRAEQWYKELLRREYFVQVHYHRGEEIFQDMEADKTAIPKHDILPTAIQDKTFGSPWINETISQLETTGYLHNHQRMRLASAMTHRHRLYRKKLADWTYYHFLDGELGSNHLSRQWVASTFSGKPYFMNEENLQKYRKKEIADPMYRGSYEEVEARLFDPGRRPELRGDRDIHSQLTTNLSMIPPFDIVAYQQKQSLTILTPRDFHPDKIKKPDDCIVRFDPAFFAHHPRSQQRVQRVLEYCALYEIKPYQGSLADCLGMMCAENSPSITMYQTRNPIYRDAQETYADRITLVPHHRCSPIASTQYTKKFFPFWEKSVKFLYHMQREISS